MNEESQPHAFRGGPFRRDNTERHNSLLRALAARKLEMGLYEHRLPGLCEYVSERRSIARSDTRLHLGRAP
jgi:hypothetical protein